jgi:hypothetical protein
MFVMTLLDSSREVRSSSLNVIPARRKHAHHPRSGIHPIDHISFPAEFLAVEKVTE